MTIDWPEVVSCLAKQSILLTMKDNPTAGIRALAKSVGGNFLGFRPITDEEHSVIISVFELPRMRKMQRATVITYVCKDMDDYKSWIIQSVKDDLIFLTAKKKAAKIGRKRG